MSDNSPFGVVDAINNLTNSFTKFNNSFVEAFGFEPRYRHTIPAQDVVIEDVIEDETKEDEDDGGNLCNRALPDVR